MKPFDSIQGLTQDEGSLPPFPGQCCICSALLCRLFFLPPLFSVALLALAACAESTLCIIYLFPNEEMKSWLQLMALN